MKTLNDLLSSHETESSQATVKKDQQSGHLLLGESSGKGGHHSLPFQDVLPHSLIRGRSATGQGLALKNLMQIWRNLLQTKIIIPVAVGAADLVDVLAFDLLRGERGR